MPGTLVRVKLTTIFYVLALLGAAIVSFGWWGTLLAGIVLAFWGVLFHTDLPLYAKWPKLSLFSALWSALIIFLLLGLLLPAVNGVRKRDRVLQCPSNIRSIQLALLAYETKYGCFPPAYITDEKGRPKHSWRVLILPFLEKERIYRAYDFREPWDGPNNRRLAASVGIPRVFQCPQHRSDDETTSYVAVVGPRTMWPEQQSRKNGDITDRTSRTVHLVESPKAGIHWMEPRDLTVGEFCQRFGPDLRKRRYTAHRDERWLTFAHGTNMSFVDGHIMYRDLHTPRDIARAWTTVDGGEEIDWNQGERHTWYWRWPRILSLSVFAVLTVLPVIWLPRGHAFIRRRLV